jgi:hypothetical protein
MKRTVLHFNVRRYSTMPPEKMAKRVGEAIGCVFQPGEFNGTDAFLAQFLGLQLHLYDWRGLNNRVVFVLSTTLKDLAFLEAPGEEQVEIEVQDISQAVADLLAVRMGGDWHRPTEEEVNAERDHSGRITERFQRHEEEGVEELERRGRGH